MKRFLTLLYVTLTGFLFAMAVSNISTADNPPCQEAPIHSMTNGASWPKDSTVNVVINTNDFPTDQQKNAIKDAYRAWQNSNPASGVEFTFSETTQPPPAQHPLNTTYVQRSSSPTGASVNIGFTGTSTTSGNKTTSAVIHVDHSVTRLETLTQLTLHEIGHTFGLADCNCPSGSSVMAPPSGICDCPQFFVCDPQVALNNRHWGCPLLTGPTDCDWQIVAQRAGYPTPTPTPSPTPTPECFFEACDTGCGWNCEDGECQTIAGDPCYSTPILIDVRANGLDLTSLRDGVAFDLNNDGHAENVSWTARGSDDSWLVLDRNNNGTIDNGAELFGNFTAQPPPMGEGRNGFRALAEYDKVSNGGNDDGLITQSDAVFSSLRLWHDSNHNGVAEPTELKSLISAGLMLIECNYKTSKHTDEFGNRFIYRAKVRDAQGKQLGRWAWDVILITQN